MLYVGTQLISGLVSTVTADPTQRRIMLALPFVFVIFIINFEAGLIVYWITTNTWTIGQQLAVRRLFPKPPPIEPKADAGSKPARGKPPPKPAACAAAVADGKAKGEKAAKGDDGRRAEEGAAARAAQEEEADRQEALGGGRRRRARRPRARRSARPSARRSRSSSGTTPA